jgi:hypothetical protein
MAKMSEQLRAISFGINTPDWSGIVVNAALAEEIATDGDARIAELEGAVRGLYEMFQVSMLSPHGRPEHERAALAVAKALVKADADTTPSGEASR